MKQLEKYLFFLLLVIAGCKKDKTDFEYDNRVVTDTRKSSSLRIINFGDYNQVQVDGDTLTNYVVRPINDPLEGSYPATTYFPDNGRLGSIWNIQQSLLNNGAATILVEHKTLNGIADPLELVVQEDSQQSFDYYLLPTEAYTRVKGQPDYVKVPRSVTAATDPSHFKVRILNLAATVRSDEGMENLVGPMSLAWADGTLVSSQTNGILPGQYSDYIELPYETAQLKVLTSTGIQVPALGSDVLNPTTSTLELSPLTYVPLKTYVPGGVYTIVIAAKEFTILYRNGGPGETLKGYQNSITVINDIADPVNLTYGRVQAVNTIPGVNGVKVLVNGKALGAAMDYTAHTAYEAFVVGDYRIEAVNAAGAVLATTTLKLDANTNFSLWVHPAADGKIAIAAVANDLSGTFAAEATDDATYARNKTVFPFNIRFLNFCPDVPYLTFTTNNAQGFSSMYGFNSAAVNNLRPGIVLTESPYISAVMEAKLYQIMAFRSSPAVVPGTWASDIPVLTGKDLIARPELYVRGALPNHEPGIYTIALVGSTNPSAPAAEKAKMIIVKHSK